MGIIQYYIGNSHVNLETLCVLERIASFFVGDVFEK